MSHGRLALDLIRIVSPPIVTENIHPSFTELAILINGGVSTGIYHVGYDGCGLLEA